MTPFSPSGRRGGDEGAKPSTKPQSFLPSEKKGFEIRENAMNTQDFLFEIGTEELPSKQLLPLGKAFLKNVLELVEKANLQFSGEAKLFATPRRLAVFIPKLQLQQADQTLEKKGPSVQAAFDAQGNPTKALEGFAKSCACAIDALEKRETAQGTFLFATQHIAGKPTEALLPGIIREALAKLPIPKPMHWGSHSEAFLRPVRWVLMLLGKQVIPAEFFEQSTSNLSCGHRFMANKMIQIPEPNQYEAVLEAQGFVIADFEKRQQKIQEQLEAAAKKVGGEYVENAALLTEVTGLVEWPTALVASFDPRFLEVPENALIAAMELHQKSFAVRHANGKLLAKFLTVSNIISQDEQKVLTGNERVMRARLSDAEFFYQKDLQASLESYLEDLKTVVFQAQLGSVYAKSQALAELATYLAQTLSFPEQPAYQAGLLAKCDLRTQMVGEFPELQGEMGKIYATKQNMPKAVADALFEQYLPRFSQDELPVTETGIVIALADRLLNLVGIFGIGQIPTGEKDPFALRRAAIGVCRIILDKCLNLKLIPVLVQAKALWEKENANFSASDVVDKVFDFIMERLKNLYLEEGVDINVIQAVMALRGDDIRDIHDRIHAVGLFQTLPEAATLAAAQKRVANLFQKEKLLVNEVNEADSALFQAPQEKALADALIELKALTTNDLMKKNYTAVLQKTAALKQPIDNFFDGVMVMTDDLSLRHNRLCLLGQLSRFLNQVADLSYL
jgi:glycyl-tRNA synthetase beta chain